MVGIVRISAGVEGNIGHDKQNLGDIKCGIDELPDDVLVNILSRLSLKESARARVLARRWRYLWMSVKILRFDHRDTSTGKVIKRKKKVMKREKFESWVNTVVELYQDQCVEDMVISFETKQDKDQYRINPSTYDSWVDFAMQKEVRRFELNLSSHDKYVFPSVERLRSHYHGVMSSPFCCLRALRLVRVGVNDEVVHYFLASCPNLEELCIRSSIATLNLRVMDPPRLRVLEISRCYFIESVEISAVNLVSLTYKGRKNLVLKEIPNLCELTINGDICESFISHPKEHWSYSVQLEKLVLDFRYTEPCREFVASGDLPQLCSLKRLEVRVFTLPGRSLLFFASLVNAYPQLCEFRIELTYLMSPDPDPEFSLLSYPSCPASLEDVIKEANSAKFVPGKLKVVQVSGYKGCSSEEQLLLALFDICPSIESVVIDTDTQYYDCLQLKNYISFLRFMESPIPRNDNYITFLLTVFKNWRPVNRETARKNKSRKRTKHLDTSRDIRATTRNDARKHARRVLSEFRQRIKSTIT